MFAGLDINFTVTAKAADHTEFGELTYALNKGYEAWGPLFALGVCLSWNLGIRSVKFKMKRESLGLKLKRREGQCDLQRAQGGAKTKTPSPPHYSFSLTHHRLLFSFFCPIKLFFTLSLSPDKNSSFAPPSSSSPSSPSPSPSSSTLDPKQLRALQSLNIPTTRDSLVLHLHQKPQKAYWGLAQEFGQILTELTVSGVTVNASGPSIIVGSMKKLRSVTIFHANLTDLEMLNLSENSISGEIPTSFGDLLSLQNVSLASLPLSGSIPDSMSAMPGLV
ncbi:hypothetical protein RJ641_002338 [Dillenia turbinata]|uniref:Uncharacterized protein n=1 Tax=Dillenia turbinata TaxID=194707 RepID=A0AAN8ZAB0_9MAGN